MDPLKLNILKQAGLQKNPVTSIKFDTIVAINEQYQARLSGNMLSLSSDYGITYTKSIDISSVGALRMLHIFTNGRAVLCGRQKAFYTDFITLNQSTVLNLDGTLWDAQLLNDNFLTLNGTSTQYLPSGQECLVWGCYNNDENLNINGDTVVECFETSDYGATIKVIWRNKLTPVKQLNGSFGPVNCRHIHGVEYNKMDGSFWIQTGDEPNDSMSHWLRGVKSGGVWSWQIIGSGVTFKTTQLKFLGDKIIYAKDSAGGGICQVKITEAGDISKHVQLVNQNVDPFGFALSNSGKIVTIPMKYFNNNYPGNMLEYSPNLKDWFKIYGDMPEGFGTPDRIYARIWQPTSKGRVLCSMQPAFNQYMSQFNFLPSVFLDEILIKNGFKNPFQ